MIRLDSVSKVYAGRVVVDRLSLAVKKGSIFGFLGPNGAGKTTTIKMLAGITAPDEGAISLDGQELSLATKERTGFMPESPYFYENLTGFEFLQFSRHLFSVVASESESFYLERLRSYPRSLFHREIEEFRVRIRRNFRDILDSLLRKFLKVRNRNSAIATEYGLLGQLLSQVGLDGAHDVKIRAYSKGMKQRLGFAQALVNNPEYVLLDEPLDGLDPLGRREIKKNILRLKDYGTTVFLNSHILSDIQELCDDIGIIHCGRLLYVGKTADFCHSKPLEENFVELIESQEGTGA